MALKQCPECKHQMSSTAKACPSCGHPNPNSGFYEPNRQIGIGITLIATAILLPISFDALMRYIAVSGKPPTFMESLSGKLYVWAFAGIGTIALVKGLVSRD